MLEASVVLTKQEPCPIRTNSICAETAKTRKALSYQGTLALWRGWCRIHFLVVSRFKPASIKAAYRQHNGLG